MKIIDRTPDGKMVKVQTDPFWIRDEDWDIILDQARHIGCTPEAVLFTTTSGVLCKIPHWVTIRKEEEDGQSKPDKAE